MLAYLANDRPAARRTSPRALALVVGGHVVLLGLVLTARGEMPGVPSFTETEVIFVDPVKPPPPPPPAPAPPSAVPSSVIDVPPQIIPVPQPIPQPLDRGPSTTDVTPYAGDVIVPRPTPLVVPQPAAVVRKAARFATPADEIRPPYPEAKRRLGEEASLRLALEVDARGRVIAVEPIGKVDPLFLDAARRHILRRWRYQPATEDGVGISSRITVTLKFELEE
jgi:protein TonB